MDLDYIQKYVFPVTGGCGGIPFIREGMVDSSTLTTTLMGGSTTHLAIPGGLIYRESSDAFEKDLLEKDPWAVHVREDFDSLLDLVTVSPEKIKKNITKKQKRSR